MIQIRHLITYRLASKTQSLLPSNSNSIPFSKRKLKRGYELAKLEKLTHSKEAARLLFKERQKIRKLERKQIKSED